MALSISLLTGTLTPTENPGLDTLDPRFQEIASLVEAGDIAKAAEQTQTMLQEGIVDIRVISYFLYGVFLESGFAGLAEVFNALTLIFGPNWNAIGPANKREKHAESGLTWFLTRLTKKAKAADEAKDAEYTGWIANTKPEQVDAIFAKTAALKTAMGPLLPSTKCADALSLFEDWLRAFSNALAAAAAPPPVEAAPEEAPSDGGAPRSGGNGTSNGDALLVEGSVHLQVLKKKLEAFDVLVKKGDFQKAGVVMADVMGVLDAFDPRLYIPKMFSGFYQVLSQNVEQLMPVLEMRETPTFKAMDQFYRVDIETFSS